MPASLESLRLAAVNIDGVLLNDTFSPVIHRFVTSRGVAYTRELERAVLSQPRHVAARVLAEATGAARAVRTAGAGAVSRAAGDGFPAAVAGGDSGGAGAAGTAGAVRGGGASRGAGGGWAGGAAGAAGVPAGYGPGRGNAWGGGAAGAAGAVGADGFAGPAGVSGVAGPGGAAGGRAGAGPAGPGVAGVAGAVGAGVGGGFGGVDVVLGAGAGPVVEGEAEGGVEETIRAYFALRGEYLREHPVCLNEGAVDLVGRLRGLGLEVVCYGGLEESHFERYLGEWRSWFSGPGYVCTDAVRPGIREIAGGCFGLGLEQVLFIDDAARFAEHARELRVPFVGHPSAFRYGFQREAMRENGVRHLVGCLGEIDEALVRTVDGEVARDTVWGAGGRPPVGAGAR